MPNCFAPVSRPDARVLVLGSLPGVRSLEAGHYYAHPRNAFWPIMGRLFGAGPDLPYERRCVALAGAGIALWDVVGSAVRPGSSDSDIDPDTVRANDFAGFLRTHPRLGAICFNGTKAEALFRRHAAAAAAGAAARGMRFVPLPSTSPANARMDFARKLAAWRILSELAAP